MPLSLLLAAGLARATCIRAATILPQASVPDGKIDVVFPIPAYNADYAAQGGNPKPTAGRLLIFVPPQFESGRMWPLVIVSSTTDSGRTSPMDAPSYRAPAAAEKCLVLATDATIQPRADTIAWRLAVLSSALDVIHRDWNGSARWPVIFAGFSGGAKRTEWTSAILAQTRQLQVRGLFLAGINDDRMVEALKAYPASPEFFRVPIWISGGSSDPVATPPRERDVQGALVHLGFKNVRLSTFHGGHELDANDLRQALKWFRQQGGF